jgi:hypothetical protein
MTTRVIRYRTRPDAADDNARLIGAVFAELDAQRPQGVRYASIRLEDDTFIHVVDGDDGALPELEAFQQFVRDIDARCVDAPRAAAATFVGSYGFGE